MIKQYIKQAWNLIRQERLFSSVYIIGTGLSITVVMVLSIIFYVKTANIYPETNRDRMLITIGGSEKKGDSWSMAYLSYHTIESCFAPIKSAEAVSAVYATWGVDYYVQPTGSREQVEVAVKYIDTNFWTIFPFHFVDGKPFTDADFQSGIHTAVIAESLAKRLFGRSDVTGEYVSMNFQSYRISGVVKDASFVTPNSFAHLWIPYTVVSNYKKPFGRGGALGQMKTYVLAPSAGERKEVKQEIIDNIQRFAQELKSTTDIDFSISDQPDSQLQSILRSRNGISFDYKKILVVYGLIFLVLLLVPAVSLSGMTESRMERRLAEMGIRRAFGARNKTLMWQILSENLLFTLLGGVVGLLASYVIILLGNDWLIMLVGNLMEQPPRDLEVVFTPAMLLNLNVFSIALGICLLMNLLSAFIPAWRMSRRDIIYSLKSTN